MDIEVGSRIIVEFPNKARMNCQFVGLSKDEFVLLKVPMTAGIRERLGDGILLQFRYLAEGKIIGFEAEVLKYQAAPVSLVFISYPAEFSEYNLRNQGRLECRFPTDLAIDGDACSGYIVDINTNGCQFVFSECVAFEVDTKAAVVGSYTTMEGERKYEFKGIVMALQQNGEEMGLGIKFEGDVEFPEGVLTSLKKIEEMRGDE